MNPMKPILKHCIICGKQRRHRHRADCWDNHGKCYQCFINRVTKIEMPEIPYSTRKINDVDMYWDSLTYRALDMGEIE